MATKAATATASDGSVSTSLVAPAAVSLGTLSAASPGDLVIGATEMANSLAGVIQSQHLSTRIQGRDYVQVEGWTTLGVMLGVTAREVSTVEHDGIYVAIVELVRMSDGAVISRASAECGEEKPWNARPRYARRSMAQTRATGKACRLAFSWIMRLAGYEPTPAEEMPIEEGHQQPGTQGQRTPEAARPSTPTPDVTPPTPEVISAAQHRLLEARIGELDLDRERVKAWTGRAWAVHHLNEIPESKFQSLLDRLDIWAQDAREAAEERAAIQGVSA